jgi:hypothetical protein
MYDKDMQELSAGKEQIVNAIAGHKACLSNPSKPTPFPLPQLWHVSP